MKAVKLTAILFTFLTFAGTVAFLLTPRHPQADFDIIGILYLLQNMVPLTVLGVTILCAAAALSFWSKYFILKSKADFE